MMDKTLYLRGFSHLLHGSRPHAQRLARETNALAGLAALVDRFIPAALFEPEGEQRRRVFTPWVTFIAFLGHRRHLATVDAAARSDDLRLQACPTGQIAASPVPENAGPKPMRCSPARAVN